MSVWIRRFLVFILNTFTVEQIVWKTHNSERKPNQILKEMVGQRRGAIRDRSCSFIPAL